MTQKDKIKKLFLSRKKEWIPLYQITPYAAQYNARIHDLRQEGYQIENKIEWIDNQKHSWLRMVGFKSPRMPVNSQLGLFD